MTATTPFAPLRTLLTGKVVLITSAGGLLPFRLAEHFATAQAKVIINEICMHCGVEGRRFYTQRGPRPRMLAYDPLKVSGAGNLIDDIARHEGVPDLLCAHLSESSYAHNFSASDPLQGYECRCKHDDAAALTGAIMIARAALPVMARRKRGAVIHLIEAGDAGEACDTTARAAGRISQTFSHAIDVEFGSAGIRSRVFQVNCANDTGNSKVAAEMPAGTVKMASKLMRSDEKFDDLRALVTRFAFAAEMASGPSQSVGRPMNAGR